MIAAKEELLSQEFPVIELKSSLIKLQNICVTNDPFLVYDVWPDLYHDRCH